MSKKVLTYHFVDASVSYLIQDNIDLKHALEEQKTILRAVFFNRLFKGEFNNEKDIIKMAQNNGIKLGAHWYAVILVRINGFQSISNENSLMQLRIKKISLIDMLSKQIEQFGYVHELDDDKIGLLLCLHNSAEEQCRKTIELGIDEIILNIRNIVDLRFTIGIGGLYGNIAGINYSFNEALLSLDYNEADSKNAVNWYIQRPKDTEAYYYPIDIEIKLMNLLKSGQIDEMNKIFKDLYRENFVKRKLPLDMGKHFIYEIWHTLIKLIDQINFGKDQYGDIRFMVDDIDRIGEIDVTYNRLVDMYSGITNDIHAQKRSHNTVLIEKMIRFLEENYANSELSLYKVAAEFNMTEVYLSQFFKEQTGENFSSYLEKIRITNAKILLRDNVLTINDISLKVGYNNSSTFRRAYKKINGVSPSVDRDV